METDPALLSVATVGVNRTAVEASGKARPDEVSEAKADSRCTENEFLRFEELP